MLTNLSRIIYKWHIYYEFTNLRDRKDTTVWKLFILKNKSTEASITREHRSSSSNQNMQGGSDSKEH